MKIPDIFVPERDLERKIKRLLQGQTSLEGQSRGIMVSRDDDMFKFTEIFKEIEQIILNYVPDQADREKYSKELKTAKAQYRKQIKKMFNVEARYREQIKKMFNVDVNYQRIS